MALPLAVNYETSADEADVGTTGGDGDAFDAGWTDGTSTVKADTNVVSPDTAYSRSLRFTTDASANAAARGWSTSFSDVDNLYVTFPFYRADTLTANAIIANFKNDANNATRGQIRLDSANTLTIRRQFTAWDTTTETLTEDTWYYIQCHIYGNSSTGTMELKLYDADQTLLETINNSSSTGDFGGQVGYFVAGWVSAATASSSLHFGGIKASSTGYPSLPALTSSGFEGWGVPILSG